MNHYEVQTGFGVKAYKEGNNDFITIKLSDGIEKTYKMSKDIYGIFLYPESGYSILSLNLI